jgi:hypothetical protein
LLQVFTGNNELSYRGKNPALDKAFYIKKLAWYVFLVALNFFHDLVKNEMLGKRPASGELEEGSGGPCYVSQII